MDFELCITGFVACSTFLKGDQFLVSPDYLLMLPWIINEHIKLCFLNAAKTEMYTMLNTISE